MSSMDKPVAKIRLIDVLTEEELRKVNEYERKIIMATTPIEVFIYKRRAKQILQNSKRRFLNSR